jgi:hypothetical protein
MTTYTNEAVDKVTDKYLSQGGEVAIIEDAVLACYGLAICYGEGLKYCVIKERYLNGWSSGNTMQFFNKLPKKYATLLNNYY